jgi:four helix bundle protein
VSTAHERRTSESALHNQADIRAAFKMLLKIGMAKINSFRDLLVWQKAMDLAVRCYGVSRKMPKGEQPVLGYQIRKCAVSMPSNIAEGKARQSTAIYTNHLWIAHGSGAELETQLELGARVSVVSEQEAAALISDTQEIGRMLQGLVGSLERSVART